jgi:hypothetical protein
MESEGIVERAGIGTASPYEVVNMSKAMAQGYLVLSSEETRKLANAWPELSVFNDFSAMGIIPSLPEAETFTEVTIEMMNRLNAPSDEVNIYLTPFHPGYFFYSNPHVSDAMVTRDFLRWPFVGTFTRELMMELGVPEAVTSGDVDRALRSLGEKYLKMTRLNIRPLLDILEKHGFEEGRTMIEKAYLRDRLLKQKTDASGRTIPRAAMYGKGRIRDEKVVVPGHGAVTHQTQQLSTSHVWWIVWTYRAACNFAKHVKGDPRLIETCEEEASRLESCIEPYMEPRQDQRPNPQASEEHNS